MPKARGANAAGALKLGVTLFCKLTTGSNEAAQVRRISHSLATGMNEGLASEPHEGWCLKPRSRARWERGQKVFPNRARDDLWRIR